MPSISKRTNINARKKGLAVFCLLLVTSEGDVMFIAVLKGKSSNKSPTHTLSFFSEDFLYLLSLIKTWFFLELLSPTHQPPRLGTEVSGVLTPYYCFPIISPSSSGRISSFRLHGDRKSVV